MKRQVTEGLDMELNLDGTQGWRWLCHECGHDLGPGRRTTRRVA